MARVEVITSPERQRRWSVGQKRAIVAESLAPDAVVAPSGRRLVPARFRWRREIGGGNGFAQVLVAPVADGVRCPVASAIEIEFAGKARMRIPASISAGLAAAVVKALSGRDPGLFGGAVWLAAGRNRHAQGHERTGVAGSAGAGSGPRCRRSVRLQGRQRGSREHSASLCSEAWELQGLIFLEPLIEFRPTRGDFLGAYLDQVGFECRGGSQVADCMSWVAGSTPVRMSLWTEPTQTPSRLAACSALTVSTCLRSWVEGGDFVALLLLRPFRGPRRT